MSGASIRISVDKLPRPRLQPTRPVWTKPEIEYPEDAAIIEIPYEPAPERQQAPRPQAKKKPKPEPKKEEPAKKISFRAVKDGDRKDWTEEEVETLIALFNAGKKYREIADEIGHEEGSIATKLKALRKKGLVGSREQLRWTPEEDAILLTKTEEMSFAMIAKKVGKSASACYSRYMKLDAKRWKEQQA